MGLIMIVDGNGMVEKMAKYEVELPIAGYISLEVEADNEEDAIEKAMIAGWKDEDIMELECYRALSEGNVICVSNSVASAREIREG